MAFEFICGVLGFGACTELGTGGLITIRHGTYLFLIAVKGTEAISNAVQFLEAGRDIAPSMSHGDAVRDTRAIALWMGVRVGQ